MAVCSAGVSAWKPGSMEKLIIFALDLVTGVFGRKGLKTVNLENRVAELLQHEGSACFRGMSSELTEGDRKVTPVCSPGWEDRGKCSSERQYGYFYGVSQATFMSSQINANLGLHFLFISCL